MQSAGVDHCNWYVHMIFLQSSASEQEIKCLKYEKSKQFNGKINEI